MENVNKLSVSGLDFSYGDKKILQDLSFDVKAGEFVSILGPSGCGKSTLLNILAGILKVERGEVCIEGQKVEGVNPHFAYMPQNDLLLPWKTILDNVCLYSEIHGNKKEVKALAAEQMKRFGLEGYENSFPSELSGGMRQRAAFLRTTLCDADIYLLDEPFGALDVITRNDLQDWLVKLCRDLNKTILLVTHDTDEAIYLSDRILILGRPGEGIRQEIRIEEKDRSREWLYDQGKLRGEIYNIIKQKASL
ncbi:MAG: ABC transporter ATP-binding protein [Lachnospiraceae bacterium]|nr:ABC transporter ATP-binding protein [Candidatus Equihabitans merdae]